MKTLTCLPLIATLSLAGMAPGIAAAAPSPAGATPAATATAPKPVELARRGRGADDGPNHDVNDDHGRRGGKGRGRDDGRRHSLTETAQPVQLARRGADDRKGDDRGGKGRGRGRDDGPRHG